jgi:hypothetical protein
MLLSVLQTYVALILILSACVKELGKTNRNEKVMERVLRYWQRLWEMDETSLLGDALKQERQQLAE